MRKLTFLAILATTLPGLQGSENLYLETTSLSGNPVTLDLRKNTGAGTPTLIIGTPAGQVLNSCYLVVYRLVVPYPYYVYLYRTESGEAVDPVAGMIGSSQVLESASCKVNLEASSVGGDSYGDTIHLNVEMKAGYTGSKQVYGRWIEGGDWVSETLGTWNSGAPVVQISQVAAVPHLTAATITWRTNMNADSQVEYGPSPGNYSSSVYSGAMGQDHSMEISPLNSGTQYYYRVTSRVDSQNQASQAAGPFTTQGSSLPAIFIETSPPGLSELSVTVDGVVCPHPCRPQWTPASLHTIGTTLRQSPYYFSYWSDNGALAHQVTAPSVATTYTANFFTSAAESLRICLTASTSLVCKLAQGQHYVNQTILVNRSGVTIEGENSDRSMNQLVRELKFVDKMIRVYDGATLAGVTIQNLTVCGSSVLSAEASGCPRPPSPTDCGRITAGTLPGNQCVDFEVSHAAVLTSGQTDPFTYTGPYAVTVRNVAFEDAAGHAISLYATADHKDAQGHDVTGTKVNDIFITGSAINRSEITGILSGVNLADYQRKDCDNEAFKDNLALYSPRNIRIEDSTFIGNNTGAMGLGQARWVGLRRNTFTNNYRFPQVGNIEGGTVFFNHCVDTIEITGNTMTGPTYPRTQGMELWGRNITVRNNPNISGYGNDGIQLNSTSHVKVYGNNVHDNDRNLAPPTGYGIGGIQVWTAESLDVCQQVPRDTNDIEIYGNTSTNQAYGIGLGDRGDQSRNVLSLLNIHDNTLSPSASAPVFLSNPFVAYSGVVTPVPAESTEQFPLNPRALFVDAVGPAKSLCQVGTRQTFTFSGADSAGASSVRYVQGHFSTTGDRKSGPTGPGCHFLYDRVDNWVYIWMGRTATSVFLHRLRWERRPAAIRSAAMRGRIRIASYTRVLRIP